MFYSSDRTSPVVKAILDEVATLHIRVDIIMDVKCFIVKT